MTHGLALGIDVGGTSIKASAIDRTGRAREVFRRPTPSNDTNGELTATAVVELIEQHTAQHEIGAVGLAVPGVVDEAAGVVVHAINLGWRDLAILEMVKLNLVERHVGLPIAFGQDVRTGAIAEATAGAASGSGVSVFMPIGTGISIATVVNGIPLALGPWAGEIGQIAMATREGGPTPLELVASASAIARRVGCATAAEVAERVLHSDPRAELVWNDAIEAIADALAWTTAITGAEVIVVGGGLGEAGALLLDPLARAVEARVGVLPTPTVVAAAFGDLSTTVGAGLLAHRLIGS